MGGIGDEWPPKPLLEDPPNSEFFPTIQGRNSSEFTLNISWNISWITLKTNLEKIPRNVGTYTGIEKTKPKSPHFFKKLS
jgi:hypothetical protein